MQKTKREDKMSVRAEVFANHQTQPQKLGEDAGDLEM